MCSISPTTPLLLVLSLVLIGSSVRDPVDPSIGVCTRKDEFARRQAAMDKKVQELTGASTEAARQKAVRTLVKAADRDIECLIRYREKALVPVLAEVLQESRKWFTRTRAAYGLKMLGDLAAVPALVGALADPDPMVREAVAGALGHLGGEPARAALEKQRAGESDPYVLATLEAALTLAGSSKKPYRSLVEGRSWREQLEGPEGAQRVAWVWTVKGASSFNEYEAKAVEVPVARRFVYPVQRYQEDLFAGYPRRSFGAGGNHAGEDCAWFREGSALYAVADGIVRMVQGAGGDWGFLVAIEHRLEDGRYVTSVYGHCAFDVLVRPGDRVFCGQRIATQGLSCSNENGGYGAHLHFGLGHGPFRRPAGMAVGDQVNLDLGGNEKVKAPVLRLVYAGEKRNSLGWPLTGFVIRNPDGSERTVEVPEQPLQREVSWFQAYVRDCRGWLDPQKLLPELVGGSTSGRD